ncbi:MAG: 16S rRNA (cytosine(967)-C(5))-methyltransferase RsmB [Eubacterium sp.]|nr:16S rRNA (cytosine(967)-C(5))-methyltransferase RsmB [Eubacterium sp.]
MSKSRLISFEVLNDVFKNNAYSNIALDNAIKDCSKEDKAFITALTYGVIERKITLEYIADKFLDKKPKGKVNTLILMGIYQLCFMDKIPSSAAVNETVKLADEVGCSYYKSLINAVLRKADKERIDINSFDSLSVKYSFPEHLVNMLKKQYGQDEIENILKAFNTKAPVFAIPNSLYVTADELWYELTDEGVLCEAYGEVVKIFSGFSADKSVAFKNGLFHIEDLSSFECARALETKKGERVLDMCCAPGGKAFTIAQSGAEVYAYDLHPHRVKLIEDGAKRLGLTNISCAVNDALKLNESIPKADKILCDVPCSGFGIIRRKPEIRYKDLDSIKELPEIQYGILSVSSKYLKDGGRIIYSTCTLNKKENERVVKRFLENNPDFRLINEKTTLPEIDGGDGFYFALMEKTND